jgi:hypothetical protein
LITCRDDLWLSGREKGTRMIAGPALTVVATAILVWGVQWIRQLRSRRRFRVTRLSEREFLISFEEPTDEEVAHVAHAILRELGWKDAKLDGPIAPVLAMPVRPPSLPLDGSGRL